METILSTKISGLVEEKLSCRLKGRAVVRRTGIDNFKVSASWAYRFMGRHGLSVRRRTHIAQRLRDDVDEKTRLFQQFIIEHRHQHDYPLSRIGNADQTLLTIDIPRASSVATKGSKTLSVTTTGHEKDMFTVMLGCTADGGKLPPYVVFKQKTLPKDKFPPGIIVRVQPKGGVCLCLTHSWLHTVWERRVCGLSPRRSMRCHKTEKTKAVLKRSNTDLTMMPGGLTSLLQLIDVGGW